MNRFGSRWFWCALASLAAAAGPVSTADRSAPIYQARPAVEGNRAPFDLVFSADGQRAYVTEMAEGTVAVLDASAFSVLRRFETGGERPAGLALTPDGSALLVANTYSGSVALLDTESGRRMLVPLPGMPHGIAVAPDGKRAFVSISQLDEVAVLDLPEGKVTHRISVGRRPMAVDITPDGTTLVVANMAGGSVSVIDTETLAEDARVRLKGINVRGIAATANSSEAYSTIMPAFNGKVTADPKEIWHNLVQGITLQGSSSDRGEDQWMDFVRVSGQLDVIGSPDQHDIEIDAKIRHCWVSLAGRDVVTRITIHDRTRDAIWPISQVETEVGANPKGLALTPDGKQIWVANHLGNSLSVIDTATAKVLRTVDLGKASKVDPTIQGQYFFNNAGMTRMHRFSCASCHPDGGADGLSWRFIHVADGVGLRNTRDLRAGIGETAPFRWSGFDRHMSEFVESEVTGLLGGPKPAAEQTRAMMDAIAQFKLPANPYRARDGKLTPEGERGRLLFEGKAGCAGCHAGSLRGGTGLQRWVGTTRENQTLDVPHLAGVYDSAPYLHDGSAATLEEVFEKRNTRQSHGSSHKLTAEELADLLRYVREL